MKRIIVPAGYMGSGSSAVTDLVSEFKNCSNDHKDFEFVFLHCPDGLFDLEDKLLIGNTPLRSDEAIRSFESQMNDLYCKKFWWIGDYRKKIGREFDSATKRFIHNIEQYNFPGFWYNHEKVNTKMFFKLFIRKPFKIILSRFVKFKKITKYKDGMRISFIKAEEFYAAAHEYIYSVIEAICGGNENVIIDQLLLPHNMFRVDRYFDNRLKAIIVERDPRDVYILNKYIWPQKELTVPFPVNPYEFARFYRQMRELETLTDSSKILRVRFEDLIYDYSNSVKRISDFLEFSEEEHIYPKTRFNPEKSIKNTQLFRDKRYEEEIKIIEDCLNDTPYLYNFPYELQNDINESVEF